MDLGKVEMFVNAQCRGAVRSLVVDGKPRSASFGLSNWASGSDLPAALQPPAYTPLLFKVSRADMCGILDQVKLLRCSHPQTHCCLEVNTTGHNC